MSVESFTSIARYTCPLCGQDVDYPCFWTVGWNTGMNAAYDIPTCCRVVVGYVWFDELPVYVGTFRNTADFRQWFLSAGELSGMHAAGLFWDHENQTGITRDIDEIPF